MPEPRFVVLSMRDRPIFGMSFADALTSLFCSADGAKPPTDAGAAPSNITTQEATGMPTTAKIVKQAAADLADYQRLAAGVKPRRGRAKTGLPEAHARNRSF